MKKLPVFWALLLVLALALGACAPTDASTPASAPSAAEASSQVASEAGPGVDVYFENGAVYTVDGEDSVAEALAVKDGEIVFVGSAAEGAAYKEGAAEVVDLGGNMLLPGFMDAHIHSITPAFFDFDLLGILGADETLAAIEAYVEANPDKTSYAGFGYMTSAFEGEELQKGPRKERLDEICPDKPMFIYSFDGHSAWVNSKCLEEMGITKDTESTPGGQIIKDDATGELWGSLKDTAMSFLPPVELQDEQLSTALQDFHTELNALGYTGIMTLPGNGFFPVPWEGYTSLEQNGLLTVRMRGAGLVTSWQTEEDLANLSQLNDTYQTELVALTSAKIFADGVMDSESAHLLEPYTDNPTNYGVTVWEQEAFNEAAAEVNGMGVQVHAHAIGDAAARMALNAIEYAGANVPEGDYRNALTHIQLVAPEDIARFAQLDVVAIAQPFWQYKAPEYWEPVEYQALGERAEKEYPMQSFLNEGVVLAFASDYPVTPIPDPFHAIEIAVTRNMEDGTEYGLPDITDMDDPAYLLWPEERVSVQDAIRGYTASAAYSMFVDDVTGTLEVGKSADLIVIDQNLLTIDPLDISDTNVLRTYLQGKLVYELEA